MEVALFQAGDHHPPDVVAVVLLRASAVSAGTGPPLAVPMPTVNTGRPWRRSSPRGGPGRPRRSRHRQRPGPPAGPVALVLEGRTAVIERGGQVGRRDRPDRPARRVEEESREPRSEVSGSWRNALPPKTIRPTRSPGDARGHVPGGRLAAASRVRRHVGHVHRAGEVEQHQHVAAGAGQGRGPFARAAGGRAPRSPRASAPSRSAAGIAARRVAGAATSRGEERRIAEARQRRAAPPLGPPDQPSRQPATRAGDRAPTARRRSAPSRQPRQRPSPSARSAPSSSRPGNRSQGKSSR